MPTKEIETSAWANEMPEIAIDLLLPIIIAWEGFVVYKLWSWFLISLGFTSITFAHAIGISLILHFCRGRSDRNFIEKPYKWYDLDAEFSFSVVIFIASYIVSFWV